MDVETKTPEEMKRLMEAGLVTPTDLEKYLKVISNYNVPGNVLQDFLESVGKYIDEYKIEPNVQAGEVKTDLSGNPVETMEEATARREEEQIEAREQEAERQVETSEEAEEEEKEEHVVEESPAVETKEQIPAEVETSEAALPENVDIYESTDLDDTRDVYTVMKNTEQYAINSGMDPTISTTSSRGASITFKIDEVSKTYLDHVMSEFSKYPGVALEFMRQGASRDEFFTICVPNDGSMSIEMYEAKVKSTFDAISSTIESTKKDVDYEHTMSQGLKNIKDKLSNDDPDIPDDIIIGYLPDDGKDTYYIVAPNEQLAQMAAERIGYSINGKYEGGIYEMTTPLSMGTKFEDEAMTLEQIRTFIEFDTPDEMHLIEVNARNAGERSVTLKSSDGVNETHTYSDTSEFDTYVLPEIIDSFAKTNPEAYNNKIVNPTTLSYASGRNTNIVFTGFSEEVTTAIEKKVEEVSKKQEEEKTDSNVNGRVKSIGEWKPTTEEAEEAAFVSMPVLLVVIMLFALMIALVLFTS